MEVVVPTANDFHFDSTTSSPYVSAPSSPKRFGDPFDCYYCHYTSARPSPSRVAAIFASSAGCEKMPRSTKSSDAAAAAADLDDFAFDFSGQLEKGVPPPGLTTADELFEKGKIRPLNLILNDTMAAGVASTTPRPPHEGTAAMVEATRERGRERGPSSSRVSSTTRSRKGSRSLSPMRSGGAGGFFSQSSDTPKEEEPAAAAAPSTPSDCLKTTSSRKWKLRDLLLFRSASEGRVTGNKSKDPLRKYTIMSSSSSSSSLFSPPSPKTKLGKGGEDSRNSSSRSTESGGGSMRRGSGTAAVSAHETHYTSNRAASSETKKKTALPFNHQQGLFGCLRFNPAVHSIAKGFRNTCSFGRRQS